MEGALLGPSFSEAEIVERAERFGWVFERLDLAHVPGVIARELAQGQVVALFQGRMEFGPRALGARSIIGDPRSPTMQSVINQRVKLRESFRPFAPSVLVGEAATWFEFTGDSPYMSFVATVDSSHRLPEPPGTELLSGLDRLRVPRSDVPAVTHVDGSARLQTVHPDVHPVFHSIIEAFYEETGCPMVVNTSFNVRGEPIVCTPEDAYRCFVSTGLDVLVMENLLFRRAAQPVTVSAAAERVVQEFD
jgi:carbamoyltransferase